MIKKKNRFLTFIFSLMPGAGQMYMGFMKIGVSFMSMFFFLIFLSSFFNTGSVLFIVPLIWFYSFFDCTNRASLDDESFSVLEDKYLFSIDKLLKFDKNISSERKLIAGVVLLILGIYLLSENILRFIDPIIPNEIYNIIYSCIKRAPKIIIGVLIIALGIKLIKGKKLESEIND